MNNINDIYFDGYYKDIWRSIIPAELTPKEVDFMVQYFNLEPGNNVLDIMCGYGRHAIALAKKGLNVTAVDNLDEYTTEIEGIAKKEELSLNVIKADILEYKIEKKYDLALCMGNSLNFFNATEVSGLLTNLNSHLKEGANLLINTWSLAEIVIRNFVSRSWSETNGLKHICESRFLFHPTRVESDSIFLSPDGSMEKKQAVDFIFSVAEMEALLTNAGFELKEVYSIPGKKKFTLGDPRAYIIAERL